MLKRIKEKISERIVAGLLKENFYFKQTGFCHCCDRETTFIAYHSWLRDEFKCSNCRSIPRNRALLLVLQQNYPNWKNLSIHESSPSGGGASTRLRRACEKYLASQYYPHTAFGVMVGEFRNENLELQTFDDESFDVVVTQDVLEHVYDPSSVFREIARTLKPGGAHVFTVPLVNKHRSTQVWATRNSDGSPNFLYEPDYHGNPIDPRGSPVTVRWGYDIVDFIKRASGLDTSIEYLDELKYGIRAEYIEVLVTRKSIPSTAASKPDAP